MMLNSSSRFWGKYSMTKKKRVVVIKVERTARIKLHTKI